MGILYVVRFFRTRRVLYAGNLMNGEMSSSHAVCVILLTAPFKLITLAAVLY